MHLTFVYIYIFLLLLITYVCITGLEFESDDEIARLSISIDFLVGLSDNVLAKVMRYTKLPMKFYTDLCSLFSLFIMHY